MKTMRVALVCAWMGLAACSSGVNADALTTRDPSPPIAPDAPAVDGGAAPGVASPSGTSPDAGHGDDDAATSSTPTPASDAGAGCGSAVVCEDFESYPSGALSLPDAGGTWHVETPDCSGTGAIAIDTTEAHSGARSLRVTGAAGYCNHVFLGTSAVASVTGTLWERFYVRLSTPLDPDHATFLAMHDTSIDADLRMGGQDGVLMWNRESDDATLPAMSPAGTALSVAPTTDAWHCVELAVNATAPTIQTWVDGALVTGLVAGGSAAIATADGQWQSDTTWAPHLVDARFGWESYAGEAETLWFDDVAIGPARIGCEN